MLIYLTDVEEGGETTFSESNEWIDPALPRALGPFSECAKNKVAFKPQKGEALVFHSIRPDGRTQDPAATHTGCPVVKGVKWVAIAWSECSGQGEGGGWMGQAGGYAGKQAAV